MYVAPVHPDNGPIAGFSAGSIPCGASPADLRRAPVLVSRDQMTSLTRSGQGSQDLGYLILVPGGVDFPSPDPMQLA